MTTETIPEHARGCILDPYHRGHCRRRRPYRPDPTTRQERIDALVESGFGRGHAIHMVDEHDSRKALRETQEAGPAIADEPTPVGNTASAWVKAAIDNAIEIVRMAMEPSLTRERIVFNLECARNQALEALS